MEITSRIQTAIFILDGPFGIFYYRNTNKIERCISEMTRRDAIKSPFAFVKRMGCLSAGKIVWAEVLRACE
jgi:hypothetical protein